MSTVMGSGSRSMVDHPDRLAIYQNTEQKVFVEADKDPNFMLVSGGAEGFDEGIAKIGIRNGIKYMMVLPTRDYASYYWGTHSRLGENRMPVFNWLLDGAIKVIYCDEIYGAPFIVARGTRGVIPGPNYFVDGKWLHANMARNQAMVDMSDGALIYEGNSSGTKDAVARLKIAKKPFQTYPFNLTKSLF